jgi:formylglycine-generating enzyme required for sulfatase activity
MIFERRCAVPAGRAAWRVVPAAAAWILCVAAISCSYPELGDPCGEPEPAADGGGAVELSPPSCAGLTTTCGGGSCCQAARVPGGTFQRGCDNAAGTTNKDTSHPATVSPFVLDRYEVTVGRFRQFVAAGKGTQADPPGPGTGAHPVLPGSGWDGTWNTKLPPTTMALKSDLAGDPMGCAPPRQTWTDTPGANEDKPINCVTWYLAMAFCIWDGGYLPTEAEWNFAASGGSEHRAYPWSVPSSSTLIDCSHANYQFSASPVLYCADGNVGGANRVGSESPAGDGKWGHADLAGNVLEWTLDSYADYVVPCVDCAALTPGGVRVLRGGGFFNEDVSVLRSDYRMNNHGPGTQSTSYGMRCARTP